MDDQDGDDDHRADCSMATGQLVLLSKVDVIGGVPWEVVTLTTLGRFPFILEYLFLHANGQKVLWG